MKIKFLALAFALLCSSTAAWSESLSGYVVKITDGDTLTLLVEGRVQRKIRLSGIDAPEQTQPFGQKSTANLGRLAFNKDATAECPKKDRYGRDICTVMVNGEDVGLAQITDGLAWWYEVPSVFRLPKGGFHATRFS